MSATLGMKNIRIKAFGSYTTIPNNAMAKLMYYLHCVATVIDHYDPILTDYQNYDELTGEQLLAVYAIATILSPDIFLNHKIFILNQDLLINSLDNQFYEITDETIGVHVDEEIVIGGRVVKVNKIMACNNNWLSVYYYSPISEIDKIVNDIKSRKNMNYQSQIVNTESSFYQSEKVHIIVPIEFESEPVVMTCWNCQAPITTQTESKWNCLSCCCCLIFDLLYCIFQAIRKRNILCFDIIHRCPKCGTTLGVYKSC